MPEKTVEVRIRADGSTEAIADFEQFSRAVGRVGHELTEVGQRLTVGITAPLAAVGGVAIKARIDWEDAMTGVAKTVDATEAELQALGAEFVALSEEIPQSSDELAHLAEQAGQLGIAKGNIAAFVETTAALRVTTDLGEEAAVSLARLANITNTAQTDFDRMGSTIVDLGNNAAATEAEITEFGLRIGAAGNIAGLATSEVLGIGAAMASVGVKAEAGGTSVQKVLIAMNTAVAEGNEELEVFARTAGLSVQEFARQFREAPAEAFARFVDGLREAGDSAATVLDELGLGNERTIRSFLSLANAGDLLRESIERGNRAWEENRALTEEAEKFYQRLGAELETLKNMAMNVAAELGEALEPEFRAVITVAKDGLGVIRATVEVFADLPAPVRASILVFTGFAAALGPVTYLTGQFLLSARAIVTTIPRVTALIRGLSVAAGTAGLAGSLGSLGTVLAVGGPVLVGLGALVTAFVTAKLHAAEATTEIEAMQRAASAAAGAVVAGFEEAGPAERFSLLEDVMLGVDVLEQRLDQLRARAKAEADEIITITEPGPGHARIQRPRGQATKATRDEIAEVEAALDSARNALRQMQGILADEGEEQQRLFRETAEARQAAVDALQASAETLDRLSDREQRARDRTEDLRVELAALAEQLRELDPASDAAKKIREEIDKTRDSIKDTEREAEALNRILGGMAFSLNVRAGLEEAQRTLSSLTFDELAIPARIDPFGLETPRFDKPIELPFGADLSVPEMPDFLRDPGEFLVSGLKLDALSDDAEDAGEDVDQLAGVVVSSVGTIVQGWIQGMDQIETVVITGIGQIAQAALAKTDPLLGTVIGVATGILGSLFRDDRSRRPVPVHVDDFGSRARDALQDRGRGPDEVLLVINGRLVSEEEARQLGWTVRRQTRRDAVLRIP